MEVNVYEISNHVPIQSEIKLKKCTEEELLAIMHKDQIKFYRNSLCFEDLDDIKL